MHSKWKSLEKKVLCDSNLVIIGTKKKQETAKGGMTGLQSGNIIGKDPPRTKQKCRGKHKILYDLEQTKSRLRSHVKDTFH